MHELQLVAPAALVEPAAHGRQLVAAALAENVPAAHCWHAWVDGLR